MDKKLIETLAKVIVATGWADKNLSPEEMDNLKDLLFQFQHALMDPDMLDRTEDFGINLQQSAIFEMYTDSPIDVAERERLMNELRETIRSEKDRALVLSALKSMVEADGQITNDEQAVLDGIKTRIESVDISLLGDLGRLVRGAMERRSEATRNAPNREKYLEDFLRNKIYYEVRRRLDLDDANLNIPDEDLRKLSAAGGMMARVAKTDGVVIDKETEKIMALLQTSWGLSREVATFVIEVALSEVSKNFDYLRMSREFVQITTPAERASLLDILFAVANADGKVSDDELKEIRNIADYLLLSDSRVNEAQSKIAH